MCFAPQRRALSDIATSKSGPNLACFVFWLRNVLRATTACTFSTSQLLKVFRRWGALCILTSKSASRHNGVHFFDIATSNSGPRRMVCFVHFEFEMCFAPQGRALFRHLNFQKSSEPLSFEHILLRNLLRATTASTFSTLQLPKVVREWYVLYILNSKCASRHNGVQFFISHLASWLRTHRSSKPTFRPSGASNHWKNTVFCDLPTFSRTWIFFLLTLSLSSSFLWLFPSLLFICPYCRKFDFETSFDNYITLKCNFNQFYIAIPDAHPQGPHFIHYCDGFLAPPQFSSWPRSRTSTKKHW